MAEKLKQFNVQIPETLLQRMRLERIETKVSVSKQIRKLIEKKYS